MADNFFMRYAKNRIRLKQYAEVVQGLGILEPRILESDRDDIFLCPICLKAFNRDSLKNPNNIIEEHVPPKRLGGNVRTITCQRCNNRAGTQLENDLKKWIESNDFDNELASASQNARLSFNGREDLGGELRYLDGMLHFIGDKHRSNPKSIIELQNVLKGKNQTINIKYRKPFRLNHAEVACLRIAYLIAFSVCGYGFLLNPNLATIRKLVDNPNDKLLPSLGVLAEPFPDSMMGINLVLYPKEAKSFLIVFDLISPKSNVTTRYGVFLPGPSEPGLNIYSYLTDYQGLEFKSIPMGNQPVFETNPLSSYFLWQEPTITPL